MVDDTEAKRVEEGSPEEMGTWEVTLEALEVVAQAGWLVVCEMPTDGGSGQGWTSCRNRRSAGTGSIRGRAGCWGGLPTMAKAEAERSLRRPIVE